MNPFYSKWLTRKFLWWSLLMLLTVSVLLASIDIISARHRTPHIVNQLLNSEDCRLNITTIGQDKIDALLLVEDPSFYSHNGLDFSSPGTGWTTISQGLGKDIYFENFTPGFSKIRLMYLTRFALSPLVSKNKQLTLFYNYVYLGTDNKGQEIRGFATAAEFYFKKPFKVLNTDEYLALVATIISPAQFRIDRFPEKNKERVLRIKKLISGDCQPNSWNDCLLEGCE